MVSKKQDDLWNEKIPFQEFLVIDQDGKNLGVMKKADALAKASSLNLDILCISPNANPAVCKIVSYDHYRFQQKQKEKQQKKSQKASIVKEKEIRLTVNIGNHDLLTKANKARQFLLKGDKVKVSLKYKGREVQYRELGFEKIRTFYQKVSDIAVSDKDLNKLEKYKFDGNFLNIYLTLKTKD